MEAGAGRFLEDPVGMVDELELWELVNVGTATLDLYWVVQISLNVLNEKENTISELDKSQKEQAN